MTRVGFLHTSPVHVATFDALLARRAPGLAAVHTVDERLLADARAGGAASVVDEVAARVSDLVAAGAVVVCCTCSTIGGVAESVHAGAPVFRVDRPMAARGVALGRRVGVVAALASTLAPTRALLHEEARRARRHIDVVLRTCEDAWAMFERGDHEAYARRVAATAADLSAEVDVVVLAQASMVGAQRLLTQTGGLAVPVLSSPGPAVDHLARWCAPVAGPADAQG